MQIGSGQSPLSLALVKALAAQPAADAAAAKAPPAAPTTAARPVTAADAGETPGELRKPPRGVFADLLRLSAYLGARM
jgi:hypothetical protein